MSKMKFLITLISNQIPNPKSQTWAIEAFSPSLGQLDIRSIRSIRLISAAGGRV